YLSTTANTYSGTTTASGGALVATNTGAFPGYASSGRITASGTGIVAVSVGGPGQWTLSDVDTFLANATFGAATSAGGIAVDTGNDVTYATNITIAGGFAKLGGGTLTLTGTNTYAGGTSVLGG